MLRTAVFIATLFAPLSFAKQNPFSETLACHTSNSNPGVAVRLEQSGEVIYSGVAGLANIQNKQQLRLDDVFQIGSVSKQFTAAAILQLIEQDKLKLSNTLGDFIKGLPKDYAQVTIERVLSHTSGLPNYNNDPRIRNIWHQERSLDDIIKEITKQTPIAKSGEVFNYSNTGYVLLGKVIEVVSGLTYADYLKTHIFNPLKMNRSYVTKQGEGNTGTTGYSSHNDSPIKVDRSWIYASGAITSTLKDMSRWHQALVNGKVISKHNYQKMITPTVLNNGETSPYGFGLYNYPISGKKTINHEGWIPGFMTWSIYLPENDLYAVAFSNNDAKHPGPLVLDMIAKQLNLSPVPVTNISKDFTKNLVGKYQFSDQRVMAISEVNKQFYAQINEEPKQRLILRADNSFSFECTENFYRLRKENDAITLNPISLYRGEGQPLRKIL
ncbi:serine hydrolase domain-containing protein [Pseudoalteromonas phenolica]|uniref:serine hydrolase domain-containing protein n=1 Tax=Pseudoalteromonas phenolica TaxID=161398 RepID=UPI00110A5E49|nr:serine hydrolase domain-containing protein [Pseudoalteromonas phenolica]TMO56400.1 serine hydrolase [Pseudoalteromonas phenolica]